MDREIKILALIAKGYTGDIKTGKIFNSRGKEVLNKNNKGYLRISTRIDNKPIEVLQHQFIYYLAYNKIAEMIDHIDRNPLNNKIENLRETTYLQNAWNKNEKENVYLRNNKYEVYIRFKNKKYYLGSFSTKEEAKAVYNDKKNNLTKNI